MRDIDLRRRGAWPLVGLVVAALLAGTPACAAPATATETLKPAIDHALRILDDPALKGAAHTHERRLALRAVIERVVDFPDAARRAMGMHWRDRTDAERAEFIALFKDVVTYSYIAQLELYAGEAVTFTGESEREDTTTVSTRIAARRGPIPVDYRMHRTPDGAWRIVDVLVEGVSLVGNYRAQFNTIIQTASYAELVRRLKARVADLTAPSSA